MELLALLAPNTAEVASAEPQSRTTSSFALEAVAERPAPADRSTGATASAWRAEQDRDPSPGIRSREGGAATYSLATSRLLKY